MNLRRFTLILAFVASNSLGVAWSATQLAKKIPYLPPQKTPIEALTKAIEEKIVEDFSTGHCDIAKKYISANKISVLRPLLISIAGYCEIRGVDPEVLFQSAKTKAPSNELIAFLHARYVWGKIPGKAEPLFRKALLVSRSPVLGKIIQDYLNGDSDDDSMGLIAQSFTAYVTAQIAAIHEFNPTGYSNSDNIYRPSFGSNIQTYLFFTKTTPWGSVSTNLGIDGTSYFSSNAINNQAHSLELPIGIRIGLNQDLQIKPFVNYILVASKAHQIFGGVSLMGIAYRENYRQSVQTSIFVDRYYLGSLSNQNGTHYRFDYIWDFFPKDIFVRADLFFEHVKASEDQEQQDTFTQNIPYSHNDLGIQLVADYSLKWITLGFYPRTIYRQDSEESAYLSNPSLTQTRKYRKDFQYGIQCNFTIPINNSFQFISYVDFLWAKSNFGATDFTDHSLSNRTIGVSLRTFWSNY